MAAAALTDLYARPEQRGKETVAILNELIRDRVKVVPPPPPSVEGLTFCTTISGESANCALIFDAKSVSSSTVSIPDMHDATALFIKRCPHASITSLTYDLQCHALRVLITHSPVLAFDNTIS